MSDEERAGRRRYFIKFKGKKNFGAAATQGTTDQDGGPPSPPEVIREQPGTMKMDWTAVQAMNGTVPGVPGNQGTRARAGQTLRA